jgi:hypothetical protein
MTDDDIPTFEIVPEHEQEEYDPDEYDAEAIGDRLKELHEEHYGDDETEKAEPSVKEKAQNVLDAPIDGDAEVEGDRLEFTPPFTKEETAFHEEGDPEYDPDHSHCDDCAFFVEGGGCLLVRGAIGEHDYCENLFSDAAVTGHKHPESDEVEQEVTLLGDGYDWSEVDVEAFSDGVEELLRSKLSKAAVEYAEVDDALFEAIQKSSWWVARQDDLSTLEKSPGIWRHDDEVPEYVREVIGEIIRNTRWRWSDFDSLNVQEARELTNLLEEKMTQPQGWSVTSLAEDIEDEFDLPTEVAAGMAADTTHNVLNTTREEAYEEMEGSEDFEFDWVNPMDHRTTKVCMGIIGEISDEGGSVPMNKLKSLLRKYALKYEGGSEGGTPDRVDQWQPHYGCRSSMVRRVQRL